MHVSQSVKERVPVLRLHATEDAPAAGLRPYPMPI